LVIAGVYYVNTINLTVDVLEPFTVQYAILGDAGNYEGTPLCTDTSIMYSSLTIMEFLIRMDFSNGK